MFYMLKPVITSGHFKEQVFGFVLVFFSKTRDKNHQRQTITGACAVIVGSAVLKPYLLQDCVELCIPNWTHNEIKHTMCCNTSWTNGLLVIFDYIHSPYGYPTEVGAPGLVQWSHEAINDSCSFSLSVLSLVGDPTQKFSLISHSKATKLQLSHDSSLIGEKGRTGPKAEPLLEVPHNHFC